MKSILLALLTLSILSQTATANGTMSDPMSRVYQCREEGPQHLLSKACKAASKKGEGLQQFYNWSDISQMGADDNHIELIEDGNLCSGGNDEYAGLDLAQKNWPSTKIKANESYTFKFFESTPHKTKYFKYYITKDGFDVKKPLKWDDLELLCEEGEVEPDAFHSYSCVMPDKVGKHIIYTIWQLADNKKAFYSCSDVDFTSKKNDINKVVRFKKNHTYKAGMQVKYKNNIYQAQWNTNKAPSLSKWSAWQFIGKTKNTLNMHPNVEVFVPLDKQVFYQDKLSKILIEFEADDSDGSVDVVMAKIGSDYYKMQKLGSIFYRLEWTPKEFGLHTIELQATDNKFATTIKTVEIEVLEK